MVYESRFDIQVYCGVVINPQTLGRATGKVAQLSQRGDEVITLVGAMQCHAMPCNAMQCHAQSLVSR